MNLRIRLAAGLLFVLGFLLTAARADAFIYWTDGANATIGRAPLDGSAVEVSFAREAFNACGLAVGDEALYWAVRPLGTIATAKLDGTEVDQNLMGAGISPCGVSVSGSSLAWTNLPGTGNASNGSIGIGSADGTFNRQYWLFGLPAVNQALSTASYDNGSNNVIYWTNDDGSLWSTPFNTQAPQQILPSYPQASASGIAVSSAGIYWLAPINGNGRLMHANLDGSGVTELLDDITGSCGVAVDDTYVYWVDLGGRRIGRALLNGSNPQPNFIDLSGEEGENGVPEPCWLAVNADTALASVSPGALDFGGLLVDSGPSAPEIVTLSNSSSTSVNLVPGARALVGPNADQFAITGDTCGATVAPGASCTITLEFSPTSLGGKSATLTIPTNDPSNPEIDVPLSGAGTDPHQTVSPTSIPFGHQLVNTVSPDRTVTLTNGSGASAPDQIGQATLVGPEASEFEIVTDGCSNTTVGIGASCQISLRFAPTVTGDAAASLTIPSNDPSSPATVGLSGTGTVPDGSVSPTSLAFGSQQIGARGATQTIEVDNSADGTGPLVVGNVSLAGANPSQFDVVFDGCSGQSISPGDECQIGVRFAPSATGAQSATTLIPSNGSPSPFAVQLTGSGVPAPPPPAMTGPNPRCKSLRTKLRKTRSKQRRRAIRRQLRRLGC